MNKILIAAVILGLGGGASAAGFGELAVSASGLKSSASAFTGPERPAFVYGEKAAGKAAVYEIRCKYNDAEEETIARLSMTGTYRISSADVATLSYEATITYVDEVLAGNNAPVDAPADPASVVFSMGKNVKNLPNYAGTRYTNHFKFALDWHGVDASIDRADLIISKEPVSMKKDEHGATIRTFTGALDVSYNDHHGDFVQTVCTQREFEH